MQKVNYNAYIPAKIERDQEGNSRAAIGTDTYETGFPSEGLFAGWGVESGKTVAIVIRPDGRALLTSIHHIRFQNETSLKWIPVKERLPEPGKPVLCARLQTSMEGTQRIMAAIGRVNQNGRFTCEVDWVSVDYWAELPEYPPLITVDSTHMLPPDVSEKILKARDAFVEKDYEEVWHWLYSIASPNYDKTDPWEDLERMAGRRL
jgi:hypothetical protein